MPKAFTFAVLSGFLLILSGASAQTPKEEAFDCGTIRLSPSGNSMTYVDLGRGFSFEFPSEWIGRQTGLYNPGNNTSIGVYGLHAASDPRLYVSGGAKVTGTKVVNGRAWTALTWPGKQRSGYYIYADGLAVEFLADGENPSAASLVALTQILSSFSFVDGDFRLDRQLAALHTGQKMGNLTIERIVPGTGEPDGIVAQIEFSGQLTLKGEIVSESSMNSGPGPYHFYIDSESASLIPQLKCPVYSTAPFQIGFNNQDFAEQQLGKRKLGDNDYEAEATVIVDDLSETFYYISIGAGAHARLAAISQLEAPK
jgi:hypothetical protein